MKLYAPFARPLYVMLKPQASLCNMACRYCYYLEKEQLYPGQSPLMSEALLEQFTQQYIEAQTMPQVLFTWHGGEPLLRPISFYRKAMELQRKYAGGRTIDNCIQTNGTLLNDEWCRFFKENNWLVGVSIDGPQRYHDAYRSFKQGGPSFEAVMKGIECLNKHQVDWNAMAVVNRLNVEDPVGFYRFFKEIGCRYIQFTPIVERLATTATDKPSPAATDNPSPSATDNPSLPATTEVSATKLRLASVDQRGDLSLTAESIRPEQWGNFLCQLFDQWIQTDVGEYFIQLFDATLANWVGEEPGLCSMSSHCGHAAVMEFNGDVYSCDHFVFPPYKLGNIREHTLIEMLYSPQQQAFAAAKTQALPDPCRRCDYLFACHGECPKNRFVSTSSGETSTPSGETGLNYLCAGYQQFFRHVAPYMDFMADELRAGRAPANVMKQL